MKLNLLILGILTLGGLSLADAKEVRCENQAQNGSYGFHLTPLPNGNHKLAKWDGSQKGSFQMIDDLTCMTGIPVMGVKITKTVDLLSEVVEFNIDDYLFFCRPASQNRPPYRNIQLVYRRGLTGEGLYLEDSEPWLDSRGQEVQSLAFRFHDYTNPIHTRCTTK